MRKDSNDIKNYITPAGLRRLQDERRFLVVKERPAVTQVVQWAASNGDRSENADYQYGKRRLRQIDSRIRFLTKRIEAAEVVDPKAPRNGERATRVFFVGGLETNIDTQARYKAYRDTLRKAKLKFSKSDVHHLDYTYESAYRLALELVHDWAGPGHCVFAANDEMAAGIIAGANARKVAVPADLAVVGFDDTRVAQMTRPLLTTVRVPMSSMGARAVELLCQRIADPDRPPAKVSLNAELVVRESCGCQKRCS